MHKRDEINIALEKHAEILNHLNNKRIFGIETYDKDVFILEKCDEYFSLKLTYEKCEQLSDLFKDIGEALRD